MTPIDSYVCVCVCVRACVRCSPLAAQADATAGRTLQQQLTQAVLEGEAPSFDDRKALAHYTVNRLRPRTWYLYR